MKEYNVSVNFIAKQIYPNNINLVENDYLSTKLIFNFDIEAVSYNIKVKFPDGFEWVEEITNNELILPKGMLVQTGIFKYQISAYGKDNRLTSLATGTFTVNKELISTDELVELDDRVPILDTLINRVNNIDVVLNEHEEERIAHENERIDNENARIEQEDIRKENELVRQQNEAIRQGNENDRKENEVNRINQYNLVNEKLENGDFTPNIEIGTTETLETGEQAYVNNVGSAKAPILNFGLPKGEKGEKGDVGDFYFATFEIDITSGNLIANKTQEFEMINFNIDEKGYFTVTI